MNETYTVALVVDPAFGASLRDLAMRMPVWIVDTTVNRRMVEKHWQQHPDQSHVDGVTTFKADEGDTREDWCITMLPMIDLHHGEYSHSPSYSAVEVYGVAPTLRLAAAFAEFGMRDITATPDGFRAGKANPVA